MQRSTAGIHAPRVKAVDHLLVKKHPAAQNVTTLPGHNNTIRQPVKTLPVRTRKSPDIQIIKGTNASTFKPIQRYKPDITIRTERTKLSPPPVRKGQIGIPEGEPRQLLTPLKRQRPAIGPGVTFQKREPPRTLHMQRRESTTRLKADRPASYTNRGGISRPSLMTQSPGFGRR
jgi:hypothetical protein